jgi:hypothetical protein
MSVDQEGEVDKDLEVGAMIEEIRDTRMSNL